MDINFEFKWIGRCQYDNIDKIWGVFRIKDRNKKPITWYAFWAVPGKRISISSHSSTYVIENLISKKESKGYKKITKDDLEIIFHNLYEHLEQSYIFKKLSETPN